MEGEMHRTMACCPTLVVYSSSVARSFLKQRHGAVSRDQLLLETQALALSSPFLNAPH